MKRWWIAGAVLAALFQTAVLAMIVADRAALLRDGQEVVLEARGYDPRDLFRGHYVQFELAIEEIDPKKVRVEEEIPFGAPVWVELQEGEDGFFRPVALHGRPPDEPHGPVIRGTAGTSIEPGITYPVRVELPFERYYAEKERARDLEAANRGGELGVILALAPDGAGTIKGLVLDGRRIYEEPLF